MNIKVNYVLDRRAAPHVLKILSTVHQKHSQELLVLFSATFTLCSRTGLIVVLLAVL